MANQHHEELRQYAKKIAENGRWDVGFFKGNMLQSILTTDPNYTSGVLTLSFIRRRRSVQIDFNDCTHEELVAFREYMNRVFEIAEPLTLKRDQEAQDELDNTGEVQPRLYRNAPTVNWRPGFESLDTEGVFDGPEDAFEVCEN